MKTLTRLLVLLAGLLLASLMAAPAAMADEAACNAAKETLSSAQEALNDAKAQAAEDVVNGQAPNIGQLASLQVAVNNAQAAKDAACKDDHPSSDKPRDHDKDKCHNRHDHNDHHNDKDCRHHDKDTKDSKVFTQVKEVPVGPVDTGGGPA